MKFTLYWLTGHAQTVEGSNITFAMNNAGIGHGALPALDFFTQGDKLEYKYDKKFHLWEKI